MIAEAARRARRAFLGRLARLRFRRVRFAPDRLAEELRRVAAAKLAGAPLVEAVVAANLAAHGRLTESAAADALALLAGPPNRGARARLFAGALAALSRDSLAPAIRFGESWVSRSREQDRASIRALAALEVRAGAIRRPLELLSSIDDGGPARRRLSRQARLLADGVACAPAGARARPSQPRRMLYYASQSLPHHPSGYGIRTHWLVRHLRARGWDISVHTRTGYPNDRWDFIGVRTVPRVAELDGVPYSFLPDRKRGMHSLDIEAYHEACVDALSRAVEVLRPAVIHCASNYPVGLAGTEVARRFGLPSIYEVRGLWHMTRASKQPEYLHSDHYELMERLEAQAARNADHVFAITAAIRDILVERGVPAGKISVLPNAVDTDAFAARERDAALAARWGVNGKIVVGYVGSFKHYEGIDYLLEAAARLRARLGDVFRLLLVGDGPVQGELLSLTRRLKLGDTVTFTGHQPHAAIQGYYSLIDVMAFPRKGFPLCEAVSPLKPFEAMAMAKALVVSDVRALAEIVEHEVTGLVFRKDDIDSLSDALATIVTRPDLRRRLAESGRVWASQNRSWSRIASDVDAVYRDLTGQPA